MRAAAAALVLLAACGESAPPAPPDYAAGGLYSVTDGKAFKVVKVLAVDARAVHIRLYKNSWTARPATVDPSALQLGSITDKDGFGVGHLPLARETFVDWQPVYLFSLPLTPEEREGVLTK